MNASKRAALALVMKRYTKAKTASADVAKAALIGEGIYTDAGKVSAEYGGEGARKQSPGRR